MKQRWKILAVLLAIGVAGLWGFRYTTGGSQASEDKVMTAPASDALQRGQYLARAGNCMHCHTQRGGAAYAGGRAIETPFGTVYSSNLTPDANSGIGNWSADDFWQAMHYGRSKDGRLLLPAFPYTNFTRVNRVDSDALYAWFRTLPAVPQANRAHALAWPFDSQWALALWRSLYFRAGTFSSDPARSPEWNRGAYLVQGLGHCSACHAARNALGGSSDDVALAGGMIPMQNWYAPSLVSRAAAGVQRWDALDIVQLLQTGTSAHAWAAGPMADVVLHSTQYLLPADLRAMAGYLKDLPPSNEPGATTSSEPEANRSGTPLGAKLYEKHCSQCHGEAGQGVPHAYPALAGSGAVNMSSPVNLVQIVLNGAFAPATGGNPRPFGMPPFALGLSDHDIAAVLSHIRSAWGNRASEVTQQEVDRLRGQTR